MLDGGARGYLAGNYVASAVVLLGMWWLLRGQIGLRPEMGLGPLLAFGVPTVPADATVFALNVVDRAYILRTQSAAAAGLFALSVKLATAVILAVRGFQLAWPPLAYSIGDDREAGRFYAAVATWYVVVTGYVVVGLTLLGRWVVRLLAAPEYFEAHEALPWVALGWAMYGLFLVLVTIGGRAGVTTRTFPAAAAGVIVNVVVLVALVDPLGIAGAGIALVAAYAVMLVVLHLLTRRLFTVPFEWGRLGHAVAAAGGCRGGGGAAAARVRLGRFREPRRGRRGACRWRSRSPASCGPPSGRGCAACAPASAGRPDAQRAHDDRDHGQQDADPVGGAADRAREGEQHAGPDDAGDRRAVARVGPVGVRGAGQRPDAEQDERDADDDGHALRADPAAVAVRRGEEVDARDDRRQREQAGGEQGEVHA